jgi:hypothetical protein
MENVVVGAIPCGCPNVASFTVAPYYKWAGVNLAPTFYKIYHYPIAADY